MAKKFVTAVFDRRKEVEKKGTGSVEILIYVSLKCRKLIPMKRVTPQEWLVYQDSKELNETIGRYEAIVSSMVFLGEEMTLANLNSKLGITKKEKKEVDVNGSFVDYMTEAIKKEQIQQSTRTSREVILTGLIEFGRIQTFADLTPNNLRDFDTWLRDGTRCDITVAKYHKVVHRYVRQVFERGIIDRDPYNSVTYPRGRYKERRPLTEEELNLIRSLNLPPKEDRVRDLFIFSAYTGLAFCDMMLFDFGTMTEKHGNLVFIDGNRLKTGSNFFTPIYKPAMDILVKYNYKLPRISNQKGNDFLHLIESRANLHKNLTFHLARHTFATISLSHDIPVENLARMLGHKDIKTTQHYAKILKSTVQRHAENLSTFFQ